MSRESQVRSLQALGSNLQKIVKYLGTNQNLLRYLEYTSKDPLAEMAPDGSPQPNLTFQQVYGDGSNGRIRLIPIIGKYDDARSCISLKVLQGFPIKENSEFMEIRFSIEVFVPGTQWFLKSDNLRPYLIMGEIDKSLKGKTINGLGKISSMSFMANFFTEEMTNYEMIFHLTQYD